MSEPITVEQITDNEPMQIELASVNVGRKSNLNKKMVASVYFASGSIIYKVLDGDDAPTVFYNLQDALNYYNSI